ncbi:hypothetical protein [Cupriavidus plantarum]|uniref:hypothetical protein n=1 Tax=Cupriavidus plantarum TaxID=942865 RepID=UPI00339D52CC
MAGVKGRSGGARAGAGRKPKEPAQIGAMSPMEFLEQVQAGLIEASPSQIREATVLLPYKHHKLGEGGKKDQRQAAAKEVASRFAAASPPKLVAAGGKKV